ncbi:putative Cytochrome C oxidase subunit III [Candidatus Hydrogenisulfobacillus filiaventi]|uniref:Putative Cytochrome C oxidase subunit III n=1 Tax=Candidatus Hydrogenisulfobacillus filiaventi TaxID=2707344 RepID=A0A6F8ZHR2_9FIRM|nr:cytochrome c oxidase subunit 3 [Bacillota bacterium]CAB1129138.1 putative Cytochrome C oxidase subunit III [Candidatus Hydrogenisulfobacillus filiaventi]
MASETGQGAQVLEPISRQDLRMYRGGFGLFIFSQIIPYVVLINVRYDLASAYVPARLSQVLGVLATVALILSAITVRAGLKAIRRDNLAGMNTGLTLTMLFGLVGMALLVAAWVQHPASFYSHYGEIFYTSLGASLLYLLVGELLLVVVKLRGVRVRFTAGNHWDVEAVQMWWMMTVYLWIATWLVFYLL